MIRDLFSINHSHTFVKTQRHKDRLSYRDSLKSGYVKYQTVDSISMKNKTKYFYPFDHSKINAHTPPQGKKCLTEDPGKKEGRLSI